MSKLVEWIKLHPGVAAFSGAALLYAVCTFFYMGAALTNCTGSLTGGVGDNTAGLILLHTLDPVHPFWSFTHATNFPYGEHLDQPVYASGAAGYFLYWLLAGLAGAVCGYNLLCAVGFLSASLIMFAFVRWLTRRNSIALLAGYAVAFTPYLQIKTGVHSSYIYEGLFVAIIWLWLLFWKRPRLSLAIWLGALTALAFYWDAYFVLIAGVLWVGLLAAAGIYELSTHRDWHRFTRRIRYGAAALITFIILLLPLVYIRIHYSNQIDSVVTSSRNAVKFDAQIYSAHPLEYLRPAETNPILKHLIPGYAAHRGHHSSNPAEYTINLSLTLLAIIAAAAAVWIYRRLRRLVPIRLALPVDASLLLTCMLAAGALAFAFSLPPTLHHLHMPTWYLTSLIAMWRVFARLYILVNLTMVTVAAVALAYLGAVIHRRGLKATVWLLIFVLVALEYQTFVPPRPVWSYTANVPPIYYRLHDRTDVHVVAEYPLDEPAVTIWPTFYQTYQRISGKAEINSYEAASPQAPLRESIRTLADPQTLPVLRALGADTVITHGAAKLNLPGLKLLDYEAGPPPAGAADSKMPDPLELYPIAVYKIEPGPKAAYDIAPETGFVPPQKDGPLNFDYAGSNGATLKLLSLPGAPSSGSAAVCLQVRTGQPRTVPARITQSGHIVWSGTLNQGWQELNFHAAIGPPLTIKLAGRPTGIFLHNLGCE